MAATTAAAQPVPPFLPACSSASQQDFQSGWNAGNTFELTASYVKEVWGQSNTEGRCTVRAHEMLTAATCVALPHAQQSPCLPAGRAAFCNPGLRAGGCRTSGLPPHLCGSSAEPMLLLLPSAHRRRQRKAGEQELASAMCREAMPSRCAEPEPLHRCIAHCLVQALPTVVQRDANASRHQPAPPTLRRQRLRSRRGRAFWALLTLLALATVGVGTWGLVETLSKTGNIASNFWDLVADTKAQVEGTAQAIRDLQSGAASLASAAQELSPNRQGGLGGALLSFCRQPRSPQRSHTSACRFHQDASTRASGQGATVFLVFRGPPSPPLQRWRPLWAAAAGRPSRR